MNRPKKHKPFPQILYVGITADYKMVTPEKDEDPIAFLQRIKTGRLGQYILSASTDNEIKIPKPHKPRNPAQAPITIPKEPDKQPQTQPGRLNKPIEDEPFRIEIIQGKT